MREAVVLLGCGDVGPIHEPMAQYSELVRDTLAGADIRFAQVERVYSERGELQPHGGAHGRLPPHMASVLTDCGFNVVSVAGNHAMDWGPEPLLDTIELLRAKGIEAIGAGRNLAEARQPALIDAKSLRVAMLAYCSVLHEGYAAGPDTAGVAPMRATARFEPAAIGCSDTYGTPATYTRSGLCNSASRGPTTSMPSTSISSLIGCKPISASPRATASPTRGPCAPLAETSRVFGLRSEEMPSFSKACAR